jgi:hypothetical protein
LLEILGWRLLQLQGEDSGYAPVSEIAIYMRCPAVSGAPTASRSPADAITFDTLKGLDDFEFATASHGKPGEWSIIENDAGRVAES